MRVDKEYLRAKMWDDTCSNIFTDLTSKGEPLFHDLIKLQLCFTKCTAFVTHDLYPARQVKIGRELELSVICVSTDNSELDACTVQYPCRHSRLFMHY